MKLEELARLAGVSKATANIILSGKADRYKIGENTSNKVMALVKKYHFAHPDATTSHQLLALILPGLNHHGHASLVHELEIIGREKGFQWLLCCTQDDPDTEKGIVNCLPAQSVTAVMTISSLWEDNLYQSIRQQGIQVIAIERRLPSSSIPCICSDEQHAAKELCQALLPRISKNESLVYFGGIATMDCSVQRLAGVKQAFSYPEDKLQIFHRDYSASAGFQLAEEFCDVHDRLPLHLFTGSFTLMEGVLKYLHCHPEHKPEQANWATFGDSYMLDLLPFNIHSSRQNYQEIASQFFLMLNSQLYECKNVQQSLVLRN